MRQAEASKREAAAFGRSLECVWRLHPFWLFGVSTSGADLLHSQRDIVDLCCEVGKMAGCVVLLPCVG